MASDQGHWDQNELTKENTCRSLRLIC